MKIIQSISLELEDDLDQVQAMEKLSDYINDPETTDDHYTIDIVSDFERSQCQSCGVDTRPGRGWFVNRVPNFDSIVVRIRRGCPYPLGDYVCARCANLSEGIEQGDKEFWVDFGSEAIRADDQDDALDKAKWLLRIGELEPEISATVEA